MHIRKTSNVTENGKMKSVFFPNSQKQSVLIACVQFI